MGTVSSLCTGVGASSYELREINGLRGSSGFRSRWHDGCNGGCNPMKHLVRTPFVSCLTLGFVTLGLGACTFASPTHSTYNEAPAEDSLTSDGTSGASAGGATPSNAAPAGCDAAKLVAVDVAGLTACGEGKGHCYDKAKVPWIAGELAACTGNDVCVPDSMLRAGGATPKSCASVLGAGGCASLLISSLAKNASSLGQDVCDAGEVCAPCVDPTHGNAPTPFCSAYGVYDTACVSGTAAGGGTSSSGGAGSGPSACCNQPDGSSKGQCLVTSAIPADQQEDVSQQECSGGNSCVPIAFVSNAPVKCEVALMDGVCLDQCFSSYLEYVDGMLSVEECGATEACVPCAFLPDNTPGCQ